MPGRRVNLSDGWYKSVTWTSGQPVRVQFRWALNAPNMPVAKGSGPPRVSGRIATFEFTGPWALLRLIATQRPSAAVEAQLSDRQPEAMEFSIPLVANPDAATGGDAGLSAATVFMRFELIGTIRSPGQPDQRQPVTLPTFPTAAPLAGGSAPLPLQLPS